MSLQGPNIFEMNDQQYWGHMEDCSQMAAMLSEAIDKLMHYIFQGKSKDTENWEPLFAGVNQAVLMRQYLSSNRANLLSIAQDFLDQVEEWQQELAAKLN